MKAGIFKLFFFLQVTHLSAEMYSVVVNVQRLLYKMSGVTVFFFS